MNVGTARARKVYFPVLILVIFVCMAGCAKSPDPPEQPNGNDQKDSDVITNQLTTNADITAITWSPDAAAVLYIQKGKSKNAGFNGVYIWKVNEEQAQFIADVSPGFIKFTWAPNSQYFLISETPGEGVSNRIFNAFTLKEEHKIQSLDVPVWSPDSLSLAYGFEQHDYGTSVGSLEVYQLGQVHGEKIWSAINYLYKVEFWDAHGNIGYIEINDKGQQSHKSTQNIRPSISGVHLRDTREAVKAALGEDYDETLPDQDILTFPEPVYRWTYEKGYRVFIGKDSGQVLEISTTRSGAETNLGVKVGDTAARVFEVYRPKYIEPESIHGGKLYGVFKVEGAAALSFGFDTHVQERADIRPESKVTSIWLTYPNIMDDDF
jgi:hypothetical protein